MKAMQIATALLEGIQAAAVRLKDGRVLTGPSHAHIYDKLRDASGSYEAFVAHSPWVDGFVTNEGRFVDREEAFQIATSADQVRSDYGRGDALDGFEPDSALSAEDLVAEALGKSSNFSARDFISNLSKGGQFEYGITTQWLRTFFKARGFPVYSLYKSKRGEITGLIRVRDVHEMYRDAERLNYELQMELDKLGRPASDLHTYVQVWDKDARRPNTEFVFGIGIRIPRDRMDESKDLEWIGVDLDGTLARYTSWKGEAHIGAPIPAMVRRVKKWLQDGKRVKVFTSRATRQTAIPHIKRWLRRHGMEGVGVTCKKDSHMTELWDDRAVGVKKNKGTKV